MTSLQALRDFINERLTAAAGEIFFVFQQTIVRYEEEVRRNRLLEIDRKIQIKFLKTELQQHRQCREAQRLNQETDYCGEQEDPEPTQIKEEPEEAEPPQIKEEPEEAEPPQIKEEPEVSQLEKQQELSTSQEGEQLILKVESGSFWVPSIEEQSSLSEPKEDPDSEQLVSRDSEVHHVTKHIDSGSTRHVKLKKCSVVLGDHVDEVPESAQQAEARRRIHRRTAGSFLETGGGESAAPQGDGSPSGRGSGMGLRAGRSRGAAAGAHHGAASQTWRENTQYQWPANNSSSSADVILPAAPVIPYQWPVYNGPSSASVITLPAADPCNNVQRISLPQHFTTSLQPVGSLVCRNGEAVCVVLPAAPQTKPNNPKKRKQQQQPQVKKPLNAFMLFLKEQRPMVTAEHMGSGSASVNKVLGERWKLLSEEQKAKYYDQAEREAELHARKHPGFSCSHNYGKRRKKLSTPTKDDI